MIYQFFITSWVLTVALEAVVWWVVLKDKPARQVIFYAVLVNSLTLPLAQYLYFYFLENLLLMEVLVVLVETSLIYLLLEVEVQRAFLLAVVANLVSALVGLLVMTLW
jgi:hypothetical protein